MNSFIIAGFSIIFFILAYHFYGKKLEKVWEIDPDRKTPSLEKNDGIDYVPAKHWTILFGHHFSSIAGAGPILGPVIAAVLWGWFPAFLWIVLGSIFLGGVHDFSSLVLSVRHGGSSIGDITSSVLGRKSKIVFSLFLWFALILVISVFSAVTAKTFFEEPKIVVPSFSLIFIAILFGFMVYRKNVNQIFATIFSLILLGISFVIGNYIPIKIVYGNPVSIWILILLVYCFIASILPVNILLQPRDYLSSFILIFGLVFGYIGLILTHPVIHTPCFITFSAADGNLWPMMFVIIACGAISGFHGLVSSGTTSKQITSELHIKKIGYGAMLTEGAVATIALLCVTAGLFWNTPGSSLNYPELMKGGNWISAFGKGYGQIVKPIFGETIGTLIAIVMVNSFVLTTLDTSSRITRYLSEELFGYTWKIRIFKNRFFSTIFLLIFSGYLAFGNWQKIWPVFGASNQLVAAITLLVAGCFLLSRRKTYFTLIPSIFMFVTTISALILQLKSFYPKNQYLLGNISVILIFLAFFVLVEGIKSIIHNWKNK